jgi:hypothetical protein
MALQRRKAAPQQRLVVTASERLSHALILEAVGAPVQLLIASRETLQSRRGVDPDWATTGVYVLLGGPEVPLGPGDPVTAYDKLLGRSDSTEPPVETGAVEDIEEHEHTEHWRARFYTGLTRDLLRRMGEHAAKPWWSSALLCRQSPPLPYDIADIGYLEGELHSLLDAAYWLKRVGRASHETAVREDREHDLETGHLPAISGAIRLMGIPLETESDVKEMLAETFPTEDGNA